MRQCYRVSRRGPGLRYSLPAIALAIACLLSGPGRAEAEEFVVGGLNFTAPAGWQRVVAPTPMRKAMFRVPNATGDGAVTFYHFGPGLGGGPQANIERWRRQFKEPDAQRRARVETKMVGGRKLHLFRGDGTLLSGAPGGAKTEVPGTAFLGAVIEGPNGDVFVRFIAPSPLADTAEAAFRKMVEGASKP